MVSKSLKKKIAIVTTTIREKDFEGPIVKLKEEFLKNNIECSLMKYGEFRVSFSEKINLYHMGRKFIPENFDLFIFKNGFRDPTPGDLYLPEIIEKMKIPLFNKVTPFLYSKSKILTKLKLMERGIKTPEMEIVRQYDGIEKIKMKFPVLVKPDTGSKGKDIVMCKSKEELKNAFEKIWEKERNRLIFIEKFYNSREKPHQDIRAFVLGNSVISSMKRIAKEGEYRSNYSLNGKIERIEIDEKTKEISITSANVLGLYMAGVDILLTEKGPVVLEVNGNPGIDGISKADPDFFRKFVKKVTEDFNL